MTTPDRCSLLNRGKMCQNVPYWLGFKFDKYFYFSKLTSLKASLENQRFWGSGRR